MSALSLHVTWCAFLGIHGLRFADRIVRCLVNGLRELRQTYNIGAIDGKDELIRFEFERFTTSRRDLTKCTSPATVCRRRASSLVL